MSYVTLITITLFLLLFAFFAGHLGMQLMVALQITLLWKHRNHPKGLMAELDGVQVEELWQEWLKWRKEIKARSESLSGN